MLRLTSLIALALAALAIGGGELAPSAGASGAGSPSAVVRGCTQGDASGARSADFYSRMRSIKGTDQMRMRFTLVASFGDGKEKRVEIPALRAWRSSKPGVRVFGYTQTVAGLEAGGNYRARVDYRWLDADGNLLRKSSRYTKNTCVIKGDLANLAPIAVSGAQGPVTNTSVYQVTVRNSGRAAASDVPVELYVDGAATDLGHIDSLAPGEQKQVRFSGPVCMRRLRVVVDPSDSIHEESEVDNAAVFACP
jgi:hypothetical protein